MAISIVRDDRKKKNQGLAGPFMRIEAGDDVVRLNGVSAEATVPATVYEPGVLFLKVTAFRRLLRSITGEKFVTVQVTDEALLLERIRLPLHANEMLLYCDPATAPLVHPEAQFCEAEVEPVSGERQLLLWDEDDDQQGNQPNESQQQR